MGMEEQLIFAVSQFPVIWNKQLYLYRKNEKKDDAWRRVEEITGIPEADCRRKWKTLADSFRRSKKYERDRKRCGVVDEGCPARWKYATLMSFMDHVVDIESGGRPTTALSGPGGDDAELKSGLVAATELMGVSSSAQPQSAGPAAKRKRRRNSEGQQAGTQSQSQFERQFDKRLLEAVEKLGSQNADEDELFLKSLLPALKRLPAPQKSELKMKILRDFYEAEFVPAAAAAAPAASAAPVPP